MSAALCERYPPQFSSLLLWRRNHHQQGDARKPPRSLFTVLYVCAPFLVDNAKNGNNYEPRAFGKELRTYLHSRGINFQGLMYLVIVYANKSYVTQKGKKIEPRNATTAVDYASFLPPVGRVKKKNTRHVTKCTTSVAGTPPGN